MRLLRLAVETKRWDLAAHTIILAAARIISNGESPNVSRDKGKKGRSQGQTDRPEARLLRQGPRRGVTA